MPTPPKSTPSGCTLGCAGAMIVFGAIFAVSQCSPRYHPGAVSLPSSEFVSPEGHLHVGTVLYLRGERIGPITGFEDRRSDAFTDHRMLHIVHLDFQGRPDQTDRDSVLRLYQVRQDEK